LRNKALRLLTTREHSKEELLRKLAQAKARVARKNSQTRDRDEQQRDKSDLETLVDDLAAQGWQSDERYAEAMIRRLTGQASRRYIAEKLAHAGIKKETAEIALATIEQDDRDVATALWSRRFGVPPLSEKERQRQVRFLLSRGFHLSDAFRIIPKTSTASQRPDETGE
jgi:regulatory protein